MINDMNDGKILVPLREDTITILVKHRTSPGESLDDIIRRIAKLEPEKRNGTSPILSSSHPSPKPPFSHMPKNSAQILGQFVAADSLGQLFAEVVDLINDLDPAGVERLAMKKARTRRYVARMPHDIHPGRPDLLVIGTRSGWYVSRNVGKRDVERALRALCDAANFVFGKDIQFAG